MYTGLSGEQWLEILESRVIFFFLTNACCRATGHCPSPMAMLNVHTDNEE